MYTTFYTLNFVTQKRENKFEGTPHDERTRVTCPSSYPTEVILTTTTTLLLMEQMCDDHWYMELLSNTIV